jgi:KipI family sensor histidine kinase inhibitor
MLNGFLDTTRICLDMDVWHLIWTSERSIRAHVPEGKFDPVRMARLAAWISTEHTSMVGAVIPDGSGVLIELEHGFASHPNPCDEIESMLERFGRTRDACPSDDDLPGKNEIVVPVCYDQVFAPDLSVVAEQLGYAEAHLIEVHSENRYQVTAMGFMPGFGYLGPLDAAIRVPRRTTPRTRVPAGSVAIAEDRTAVYPHQSAGGWNLIGRTPMRLFDPSCAQPSLLRVGDWVRFEPISRETYEDLRTNRDWGDR